MEKKNDNEVIKMKWKNHSNEVINSLCSQMSNPRLLDIKIRCGNKSTDAHKFMLAAHSKYFRKEFQKNPTVKEIAIQGLDIALMKSLIKFMYTGHITILKDNVEYLWVSAKYFEIDALEKTIIKSPFFNSIRPEVRRVDHTITNAMSSDEEQYFDYNSSKKKILRNDSEKSGDASASGMKAQPKRTIAVPKKQTAGRGTKKVCFSVPNVQFLNVAQPECRKNLANPSRSLPDNGVGMCGPSTSAMIVSDNQVPQGFDDTNINFQIIEAEIMKLDEYLHGSGNSTFSINDETLNPPMDINDSSIQVLRVENIEPICLNPSQSTKSSEDQIINARYQFAEGGLDNVDFLQNLSFANMEED